MATALQNLNFIISLTDRMSGPMGSVMKTLNAVQQKTMGMGLMKVGIGTAGIAGIGYAVDKVTEKAVEFESKMADVRKVTNFPTPTGLQAFGDELLKLSHTIPISAAGLAEIATAGGQLGIAEKDLLGFTKIVSKMSTAFDMMPQDAGEAIAKLSNIFHVPITEMERMGDAINYLDNNMAAKSRDIVDVLARIGGTAQLLGMTTTQATALSAAMLSLGQTPELAGTSINALLLRLGTARNQSKDFIAALGDIGLSVDQLEANLKSGGAQATINDFLARISKLDKAAQLNTLGQLFGAEYSDNLGVLIGGLDQYRNALGLVNEQSKFQGSMQQEFAVRSATTENHLKLLGNLWEHLMINVGTLFLPLINSAVAQVNKFLEPLISGMQAFAKSHPVLAEFFTKFAGLGAVIGVVSFGLIAIVGLLALIGAPLVLLGTGLAAIGSAVMTLGLEGIGQMVIDLTGSVLQFFGVFGAVDWLIAKWDALTAWWQNFDLFMSALRPFELLVGGAIMAIDAVFGVLETLKGWWTSFKVWLASLDPFGALVSGINNIIAKVQGIASAFNFSLPSLSVPSLQAAPSAGGMKGVGGRLAAAAGNTSNKSVSVTVNNHGGSVSPAAIAHHLQMAGG